MSNQLSQETKDAIAASIYEGRKINAIKIYREASKASLADAKDFIEALTVELYERHPENFVARKNSGCGAAFLILFVIGCFSIY